MKQATRYLNGGYTLRGTYREYFSKILVVFPVFSARFMPFYTVTSGKNDVISIAGGDSSCTPAEKSKKVICLPSSKQRTKMFVSLFTRPSDFRLLWLIKEHKICSVFCTVSGHVIANFSLQYFLFCALQFQVFTSEQKHRRAVLNKQCLELSK